MSEGGSKLHVMRRGELLLDVALEHGHLPETIWMHDDNAPLRAARHRPECLMPGDRLVIPGLRQKSAACETGRRHRFVRQGTSLLFRVQLLRYAEPLAGVEVSVEPDAGAPAVCRANAHGFVEARVLRTARRVVLRIEPNTPRERRLHVSLELAAWNTVLGAQQRLRNLGYPNVKPTGFVDDATFAAALDFQSRVGLDSTGILDVPTKRSLETLHDTGALMPLPNAVAADAVHSDDVAAK